MGARRIWLTDELGRVCARTTNGTRERTCTRDIGNRTWHPSTSTMEPRRWATRSAVTGFSQLPPPPVVEAPTPVLGPGVGGMLPARMSVNVDEHHALHARKKRCTRQQHEQGGPRGHADVSTSQSAEGFCACPLVARQSSSRNHTLGKATLVSHKHILRYTCFLWRTNSVTSRGLVDRRISNLTRAINRGLVESHFWEGRFPPAPYRDRYTCSVHVY